jgi:tryptophan synthase alpha chain
MAANRIRRTFENLREQNTPALIPYITAGFPQLDWTVPLMEMLASNGADIIELGVPFSDPIADGPTIQRACKTALEAGTTLEKVLWLVREFRKNNDTPIVLFGALNPFYHYGLGRFARDAADAGADAVLIPDVPVEEAPPLQAILRAHNIDFILLVAPTTPLERKKVIAQNASGFLYYISVKGVTGARAQSKFAIEEPLRELRQVTDLPVVVGFGIATPEQARQVALHADGVVVGSALIEKIAAAKSLNEALQTTSPWFKSLKEAICTTRAS